MTTANGNRYVREYLYSVSAAAMLPSCKNRTLEENKTKSEWKVVLSIMKEETPSCQ